MQDTPAYVLGVLGSRGNDRALDLLAGHLEDSRPQVRRRSMQAFEFGVRPDLAVERLRQARTAVASPSLQRDIDALLERLQHSADK